jgi:anhydro-N-acetylmuramic acid kinase
MADLYIGLMSGTSVDGIDAGLIDFSAEQCKIVAFHYQPFSETLKQQIRQLCHPSNPVLLTDYGSMDTRLGHLFAEAVMQLLLKAKVPAQAITAIGSHGLTIYHAPQNPNPFCLQIGDPNIIAQTTGITTIADFRRRDIAAQGQGAPLVPAFHQSFFGNDKHNVCVANIGGIANITLITENKVCGFDTGPGNTLMDYWINKNLHQSHDHKGEWAKTGIINNELLERLKKDHYFQLPPAKSTGKEYFSSLWLEHKIGQFSRLRPEDVQATLCQLTADTISSDILQYAPQTEQTLVCGGGSHNNYLMKLLQRNLPHPVKTTATVGIDPDHVEAAAFAWLAKQTLNNKPGNLCMATGASAPVILGGIYPGTERLNGE